MSDKKSLGLVLLAFGFILLALTGIRTVSSPDIFTHIALGQAGSITADPLSYTMAGTQWINMHPLYNSIVYMLWSLGGAGLITLVHVLVVAASFGILLHIGKDWGGPLSQSLGLLICSLLLVPVFNPGPGSFFMLFTALFLLLLYRVKNFALMAGTLLVLQVLWTNMHPSFLAGPALVLLFAIENWQNTRSASRISLVTPLTTRLLALTGASLLVTLINPNLINLHRHVIANITVLTGKETLEWISLFSGFFPAGSFNNLTRLTLLLGAGGLITLQKRLPVMLTVMAIAGAVLSVISPGMSHLFAFLAFPFIILSLNAVSDYLTRTLTTVFKASKELLYNLLSGVTLILIIISIGALITNRTYASTGSASQFGLGVQADAFPVAAAGILSRDDFPKTILNLAHDGGYIALKNSERKVFCDTRTSFYGRDYYKTLDEALRGQPAAWNKIMSDWNPHAAVLNGCWPDTATLANRLISSGKWKLAYFDGSTVILVRDLPEYATLINDPSVQKSGLEVLEKSRHSYIEQNKGFVKAGNPSRLIGAADLYLALNRPQEAKPIYTILTQGNPRISGAWMGLGRCLLLQKKISEGITYMEKAVEITPRNSRAWIALFQAYVLKGDETKARYAVDQLNKFYKADKLTIEEQEAAKQKKTAQKPAQPKTDGLTLPAELKK